MGNGVASLWHPTSGPMHQLLILPAKLPQLLRHMQKVRQETPCCTDGARHSAGSQPVRPNRASRPPS